MIERNRYTLADLLAGLPEPAWQADSLCAGWRVRDVAAHVTLSTRARPLGVAVGLLRARGNFNRYVAADARARSGRPPTKLVGELRDVAGSRYHPPGTTRLDPLVDVLVHTQDIAVPLGITAPVDPAEAIAAADRVWTMGFPFHARRRLTGVRLVATDAAWTRGDGSRLLEAPLATLLLVLTGRPPRGPARV